MYTFHVGESQHFRCAFPGRQPGTNDNSQFAIAKCILQIASCNVDVSHVPVSLALSGLLVHSDCCRAQPDKYSLSVLTKSEATWMPSGVLPYGFFLIRMSRVGSSFSHSAIVDFEVLTPDLFFHNT